jgi:hypothetical protein
VVGPVAKNASSPDLSISQNGVGIIRVAQQVLRCHSERKGCQLNSILAAFEGFVD